MHNKCTRMYEEHILFVTCYKHNLNILDLQSTVESSIIVSHVDQVLTNTIREENYHCQVREKTTNELLCENHLLTTKNAWIKSVIREMRKNDKLLKFKISVLEQSLNRIN